MRNSTQHIISENLSINEVINKINKLKIKLLIACDKNKKFLGTISDGDIRRFIIKKKFNDFAKFKAKLIINKKSYYIVEGQKTLKNIPKNIKHVPLLNQKKKFLKIIDNNFKKNINFEADKDKVAIILAGGLGKRLRPLTYKTPKPLVLVKKEPNLLRIINLLEQYKFEEIIICAHYKFNQIQSFINNNIFKSKIKLIKDKKQIGTAGPIGNLDLKNRQYLILNSDLVFNLDIDDLYRFHKKTKSQITICIKQKSYKIPYGIIDHKNNKIKKILEKPDFNFLFNAGIYLINYKLLNKIKKNKFLSMVDFINNQISKNKSSNLYFLHENWLDIANLKDLELANKQ